MLMQIPVETGALDADIRRRAGDEAVQLVDRNIIVLCCCIHQHPYQHVYLVGGLFVFFP